ncbi:MAG: hypothetical protein U9R02_00575, partial [Thermodesulfobacteriota bacterium]|nr:hypothetical protein [Thermodesulfobacteriota bacterium]
SKVAQLNVVKTTDNPCPMLRILNPSQPVIKNTCCIDFVFHKDIVAYEGQIVKGRLKCPAILIMEYLMEFQKVVSFN